MAKFSVIVPIFNVEQYLEECVRSIQAQTLKDLEIILVDDGSTDSSGSIADRLAKSDERIIVIHRENGGLGPARNTGIGAASGEYVGFVDSDDWVDPDMYSTLYDALELSGADICYSGIRTVRNGIAVETSRNAFGNCVLSGKNEVFKLRRSFYGDSISRTRDDGIPVSVCVSGYRRKMLLSNGVHFENVRSEDILFNAKAAAHAESVVALNGVFYNYRQDRPTSITKAFKSSTLADFEQLFEKLVQYALAEDNAYRDECLMRSKKRIIDYARALGTLIVSSSDDRKRQCAQLKRSAELKRVRWALKAFPFWRLTPQQALYSFALKIRCPWLMWALQELRRHG